MRAEIYDANRHRKIWDQFVANSGSSNWLLSRSFLDYHGERFTEASILIFFEEKLVSIFVAAELDKKIISHPGLTYAGWVNGHKVDIGLREKIVTFTIGWYQENNYESILIKTLPFFLVSNMDEVNDYFLLNAGAEIVRGDLWNVIPLYKGRKLSKGRKWGVNRAGKNGVVISKVDTREGYSEFYQLLTQCLQERHGAEPIHTFDELLDIKERIGGGVQLWGAFTGEGKMVSGTLVFLYDNAWHTQYIASDEQARDLCGVDLLIEMVLQAAEENDVLYFSFGASSYNMGRSYNKGLFDFKAGFGKGNHVQYFFEIPLGG